MLSKNLSVWLRQEKGVLKDTGFTSKTMMKNCVGSTRSELYSEQH